MFFSMLFLVAAGLATSTVEAVAEFTVGDKSQLIRYDYAAEGEPLRATEIIDIARADDGRTTSVTLLSAGKIRFVRMLEIDRRVHLHVETIVNSKRQKV